MAAVENRHERQELHHHQHQEQQRLMSVEQGLNSKGFDQHPGMQSDSCYTESELKDGGFLAEKEALADEKQPHKGMSDTTPWRHCFILSCVLHLGFIIHGIASSMPAAALLDIALLTQSSIAEISWIFTGRSLGGILGALLLPILSRKWTCWTLIGVAKIVMGIHYSLVPYSKMYQATVALFTIIGVAKSLLDAGSIFLMLDIWGPKNGPWTASLCAIYGLGAILGPLIAEPFIASQGNITENTLPSNNSAFVTENDKSMIGGNSTQGFKTDISTPFAIASFLSISVGVIFLVAAYLTTYHWTIKSFNSKEEEILKEGKACTSPPTTRRKHCMRFKNPLNMTARQILGGLLCVFIFACCLVEHTGGMFLVTFAVENNHWPKRTAIFLLSMFFMVMTASRGLSAVLGSCVKPKYILFFSIVICILSATILIIANNTHAYVLWFCTFGLALGFSPLYSFGITYTNSYIVVGVTLGAFIQIACTSAAVVAPFTIGSLYGAVGPVSFMYLLLIGSCLLLAIFLCMYSVLSVNKSKLVHETTVNL